MKLIPDDAGVSAALPRRLNICCMQIAFLSFTRHGFILRQELEKIQFFSQFEIFRIMIRQKKNINYDHFEIATKQCK